MTQAIMQAGLSSRKQRVASPRRKFCANCPSQGASKLALDAILADDAAINGQWINKF